MSAPPGIKFLLLVNKQGQTRLSKWMPGVAEDPKKRRMLEHELVRKCIPRETAHANFLEHVGFTIVYRRYASLFFICGIDKEANPLIIWELIHLIVETLNTAFERVSELDIMINLELAHLLLDEMLGTGSIIDVSPKSILAPWNVLPVQPTRRNG